MTLINKNAVIDHGPLEVAEYYKTSIPLEDMVFGCSFSDALGKGGHITRAVLSLMYLNKNFQNCFNDMTLNVNVDTRVTQCMKGFYPSIGGWHMDEVPRSKLYSQPDFSKIEPHHKHFLYILSSTENHSRTEFINEPFEVPMWRENVYQNLDEHVNNLIKEGVLSTTFVKEGHLYEFDKYSVHRATPANNPGWRFFIRVSFSDRKNVNERRRQVQVYIDNSQFGW